VAGTRFLSADDIVVTDVNCFECNGLSPLRPRVRYESAPNGCGVDFAVSMCVPDLKSYTDLAGLRPIFDIAQRAAITADAERTPACACGLASSRGPLPIYNEEAFRHFLEIERKRTKISNRPFLLALINVSDRAGLDGLPRRVFDALSAGLRETDFVGWHREHSVIGAVLTEHSGDVATDVAAVVSRRVTTLLTETLPNTLMDRLQIRVYQVPPVLQGVGDSSSRA